MGYSQGACTLAFAAFTLSMKYDGPLERFQFNWPLFDFGRGQSSTSSQPFIAQQACLRDRRLSPFATGLKTISGFPQMRRATIAALFMATIVLGGCNTVRGVGDDLKSVANTVDDAT